MAARATLAAPSSSPDSSRICTCVRQPKGAWLQTRMAAFWSKAHLSSQRDGHLIEGKQPFKIYLVQKLCTVFYLTNVGLLFQTNLIFNPKKWNNEHAYKATDLHNRAMTLPIFCNIPPSEGSSRGHVATLPAASLASAIQNSAHLVRINPQHVCEPHWNHSFRVYLY